MKLIILTSIITLAFNQSLRADSTVSLTGVHNCCKKCDDGITKAVKSVDGASVKTDKGNVTITAADEATAKKAVSALLAAGYAGQGATAPAVTDAKVKSATVGGVHLCCDKCVKALDKAVMGVSGVTKQNASKGAKSFTVEGDFSTQALLTALNNAGFNGSVN